MGPVPLRALLPLEQVVPGLHFPDLDLTTALLQPRWTPKDLIK